MTSRKLAQLLQSGDSSSTELTPVETARAYVRVSHERSAEKAISPETQRRRIEAYAHERGYQVKEWYTELAKSAFRDDELRTEFRRMLADAKADPATSVVLVYRYDRFSRGMTAPAVQEDLLRHGVRIESAEEGYYDPDSEVGAIMMPLTWSLNRLFSIKLRNVVIPNMKTNFEQRDPDTGWAYKNGGWAQFGYKAHRIKVGRSAKSMDIYKMIWLLDDTIAFGRPVHEWARTMLIEWRLKERLGFDSIANRLTNANLMTPTGRLAWSPSTIQALIGDWTRLYQYAGYAFWNREDCTDRRNRRQRDMSEWIVVPNAHPAIISEEEADAIQAMMEGRKERSKTGKRGEVSPYALSGGLLKCAHCGANYAGATKQAGRYYACGSHIYRRGAGCGRSWYIPAEQIEDLVFTKILRRIESDDTALQDWIDDANAAILEQWRSIERTSGERRNAIQQLDTKLDDYLDMVGESGDREKLKRKIKETSAVLNRLRALESAEKPDMIDAGEVRALREQIESASGCADPAARRAIIKEFVIEIVADAETKMLEGRLIDPRASVGRGYAAPRGLVPTIHKQTRIGSFFFRSRYSRRRFRV